jgi:hypothetical protein
MTKYLVSGTLAFYPPIYRIIYNAHLQKSFEHLINNTAMVVLFEETVEEIPNLSNYITDDDNFSDASQSMDELLDRNNSLGEDETSMDDELLDRNNSLGEDETFLDSLDEHALDELAQEISSDKAFQENIEDTPTLDSSDFDLKSSAGMSDYIAKGAKAGAGLFSGAALLKAQAFIMRKISSLRKMPQDDDDVGVGLDDLVDLDDLKNAAYQASAESTRNGLGVANLSAGTPPVGLESAA